MESLTSRFLPFTWSRIRSPSAAGPLGPLLVNLTDRPSKTLPIGLLPARRGEAGDQRSVARADHTQPLEDDEPAVGRESGTLAHEGAHRPQPAAVSADRLDLPPLAEVLGLRHQ